LRLALSQRSVDAQADGIYGPTSRPVVARFQQASAVSAIGAVDAGLFSKLGLLDPG